MEIVEWEIQFLQPLLSTMIETFNHLPRFWHLSPLWVCSHNHHCSHGCPYNSLMSLFLDTLISSDPVHSPQPPHPCTCLQDSDEVIEPLITPYHLLNTPSFSLSFLLRSPVFFQILLQFLYTVLLASSRQHLREQLHFRLLKYFLPPSWILAFVQLLLTHPLGSSFSNSLRKAFTDTNERVRSPCFTLWRHWTLSTVTYLTTLMN